MAKVYVAASFSDPYFERAVVKLRSAGHQVYNYKEAGVFDWDVVGRDYDMPIYAAVMVQHPEVKAAYAANKQAMSEADAVVVVLPSGVGTAMYLGMAIGMGKPIYVYETDRVGNDVMLAEAKIFSPSVNDVVAAVTRDFPVQRGWYAS